MKALILSTKTGQGHNSASHALKASLEAKGHEAVVADILKSGKKNVSAPVSAMYDNLILHMPTVFGALYHAGELVSSSKYHSPIYYLNSIYCERLYNGIEKIAPQAIVCPHIFSAQAITRMREKYGVNIPAIGIVTDYTCSPFWEETRLDAYIIPAPQLADEFVKRGLPAHKLHPLGIPISPRFKKKVSREEARRAFSIQAEKVFVVFGGSMGYGCIPEVVEGLVKRQPDAQVAAVCGSNKKLYYSLKGIKNVLPFEYIENVDVLMDAADVLITKPGGLSATEAMAKRLPIVFSLPIPGGEERNAEFLTSIGAAVYARKPEAAVNAAADLIQNPDRCAEMMKAQAKYINNHADDDIAKLLIQMTERVGG